MPCGLYSEKKRGEVKKKIILTSRRWKKNSSDIKLCLSLPALGGSIKRKEEIYVGH